jgi:tetratricopeptide (TPR) repeat protein
MEHCAPPPPGSSRKRDLRLLGLVVTIAGTTVVGYAVTLLPGQKQFMSPPQSTLAAKETGFENLAVGKAPTPGVDADESGESTPHASTIPDHVSKARNLIARGRYDEAIEHLTVNREQLPSRVAGLQLVGEALLGKHDYRQAFDFFQQAVNENPNQQEAYFGLAVAAEALGNLSLAIGGMRTFLHLEKNPDPYRLKVAQARSAIWEWEAKLGRGAWGPTQGIPPGFTVDELKRDGMGVATKMPIAGTENAHGFSRYEIKHSDYTKIFKK